MADIALLVVEEFHRTAKKTKKPVGRGSVTAALGASQETPAGAGDPAAPAAKRGEWGSWAAAALRLAAFDGSFSA